jgi:hypothetical protein
MVYLVNNRKFGTLENACKFASDYHEKTGIIVAVESVTSAAIAYDDDGSRCLYIEPPSGLGWTESLTGWTFTMDLIHGLSIFKHADGRQYIGA